MSRPDFVGIAKELNANQFYTCLAAGASYSHNVAVSYTPTVNAYQFYTCLAAGASYSHNVAVSYTPTVNAYQPTLHWV